MWRKSSHSERQARPAGINMPWMGPWPGLIGVLGHKLSQLKGKAGDGILMSRQQSTPKRSTARGGMVCWWELFSVYMDSTRSTTSSLSTEACRTQQNSVWLFNSLFVVNIIEWEFQEYIGILTPAHTDYPALVKEVNSKVLWYITKSIINK